MTLRHTKEEDRQETVVRILNAEDSERESIIEEYQRRQVEAFAPTTRRNFVQILRMFERWCDEHGFSAEPPVSPQVISALSDAAHHVEQRQPLSQRQERLQECLERLPRRSRELIARYYNTSGESGTRVARQFGQNVNAVYAKIHRIRTILRDCIAQRLQQESGE